MIEWKFSPEPIPYAEAMDWMGRRVQEIRGGTAAECIWVLSHPPLYTLGRTPGAAEDVTAALPHPLYETPRGGRITYHDPGQVVIYVMLDLRRRGRDLRIFLTQMLSWLQRVCAEVGVETTVGWEGSGLGVGLWTSTPLTDKPAKIVACGVRVEGWVTSHGVALNVQTDLTGYQAIRPCGLDWATHEVTSLRALGVKTSQRDLFQRLRATSPWS